MSKLVAQFDPSTGGGAFQAGAVNRCSALWVMNESANFLQLDFAAADTPKIIQPWSNRLLKLANPVQTVNWTVVATLQSDSPPVSLVFVELYDPNEDTSALLSGPLQRQTNVGNSVNTNATTPNSIAQDVLTPFVLGASSLVATKDGSVANRLDVAGGVAWLRQHDGSLGRQAPSATFFLTVQVNSTYFLDLNPDGSWSFNTSHSGQANYLPIAQVTTDASGNIAAVTDERTLSTELLASLNGTLSAPNLTTIGVVMAGSYLATQGGPLYLDLPNAINGEAPGSVRIGQTSGAAGAVNLRIINATGGYIGIVSGGGSKLSSWDQLGNFTLAGTLTTPSVFVDSESGQTVIRSQPTTAPIVMQANGHNTVFNADGTLSINGLGGQVAAGSFGAPVIVAQALDVHVTATTNTTILAYTTGATGLYRISAHVSIGDTTGGGVKLEVTYTDPHLASPTALFANATSGAVSPPYVIVTNSVPATSSVPTYPLTVYAANATAITVIYQNPNGVPNDYVTAIIERLA